MIDKEILTMLIRSRDYLAKEVQGLNQFRTETINIVNQTRQELTQLQAKVEQLHQISTDIQRKKGKRK